MPQGVFCRLAVELVRQRWKLVEKKSTRTLLKYHWEEFMIYLKESLGFSSLIPQVVEILIPSEMHIRCKALLHIVKDTLFLSTQAVLGSHFSSAPAKRWKLPTSLYVLKQNKYFEFKKLVRCRGAPELELLAVVIVLFTPTLHENLTNSNFDTNTICQLSHGSSLIPKSQVNFSAEMLY